MATLPLLIFACSLVGATVAQDALPTQFLDNVLAQTLPRYAQSVEAIPLQSFNFKIRKTGITNRDVKAEFHNGVLSGLTTAPGLRRIGDCSPVREGHNFVLGCYVSLEGVRATYSGSARGDTLRGINKTINVEATFPQSKAFLELSRAPGAAPSLRSWSVLPLNIRLTFSRTLDLNSERQRKFEEAVRKNIEDSVTSALYGPLRDALIAAIRVTSLQ